MKEKKSTVGEKIASLRKLKRFKQGELAKMLGISKGYLSQIETGVRNPSLKIMKKFSLIFGVSVDYFIYEDAKVNGSDIPEPIRVFFRTQSFSDKDIDEIVSLFEWWREKKRGS
ncbi:MAG: helix-turn-helix domain-containing protein [bacterium]